MSKRINTIKRMIKRQDWFAFLIELIIVVLGITIAYQLNRYQQNATNQKVEKALLDKLYIESQQNLAELEKFADVTYLKPVYLNRLLVLLDTLAVRGKSDNIQHIDSASVYIEEVVSTFTYPLKEEYLTTYLNRSSELGQGLLAPELMKLQALYADLRNLRVALREYRVDYIWVYTDLAYDRSKGKIDLLLLADNIFRNRLMKLANIEQEHTQMFKETVAQLKHLVETL